MPRPFVAPRPPSYAPVPEPVRDRAADVVLSSLPGPRPSGPAARAALTLQFMGDTRAGGAAARRADRPRRRSPNRRAPVTGVADRARRSRPWRPLGATRLTGMGGVGSRLVCRCWVPASSQANSLGLARNFQSLRNGSRRT